MGNIKNLLNIFIFTAIAITSLSIQAAEEVLGYNLSAIKDDLRKIVVNENTETEKIRFDLKNKDGSLKPLVLEVYDCKTTVFRLKNFPEIVFKPSVKKEGRNNLLRGDAQSRMDNHLKVKKIIEENKLDMLILPETVLFEMDFENNVTLQVIAEKKQVLTNLQKKNTRKTVKLLITIIINDLKITQNQKKLFVSYSSSWLFIFVKLVFGMLM